MDNKCGFSINSHVLGFSTFFTHTLLSLSDIYLLGRVNSWLNFKWGKTTPGTSSTPGQPPLPSGPPLPPEPPKPTRPIVPGMQTHRGFVPMTKPGMQPPAPGRFAPMQARPPGPPGMGGSSFARPPVPPQEPAEKKKKKKEKRFNPMGFRPPKHKPESR